MKKKKKEELEKDQNKHTIEARKKRILEAVFLMNKAEHALQKALGYIAEGEDSVYDADFENVRDALQFLEFAQNMIEE